MTFTPQSGRPVPTNPATWEEIEAAHVGGNLEEYKQVAQAMRDRGRAFSCGNGACQVIESN